MRRVAYGGAMSLDGFIAGPNGEYDWILMDPDLDFAAMTRRFDTFLIGRKTFEAIRRMSEGAPPAPGIQSIVCAAIHWSCGLQIAADDARPTRCSTPCSHAEIGRVVHGR